MAQHIESAVLYGNLDDYAYYFVDLLVGTPPQRVSVIVDTGSGLCAFSCASCKQCGHHLDPNFDFGKSKTAKWAPCGQGCQDKCTSGHCSYYQGYQEGSSISGYWFTDWVSLGDTGQQNPPVYSRMGCHHNENKLFYAQKANGILGMRSAALFLQNLFKDKRHVESRVFTMCLAENGGRLVMGGYNDSYHRGNITWLKTDPQIYAVQLTSMRVGDSGKTIQGLGRAIVDSGSTFTYFGSGPYKALRSQIETYCRSHKNCGASLSGTCWKLASASKPSFDRSFSSFPIVEMQFGARRVLWEARSYLYLKGARADRTYCYAFEDDGPGRDTVLGASWMLYHDVIFDLRHNTLGVVRADCPQYKKRPSFSMKTSGRGPNVEKQRSSKKKGSRPETELTSSTYTTSDIRSLRRESLLTSITSSPHLISETLLLSTTLDFRSLHDEALQRNMSAVSIVSSFPIPNGLLSGSSQGFLEFTLSSGSAIMFIFVGISLLLIWWRRVGRGLCTFMYSMAARSLLIQHAAVQAS